MSHKFFPSNYSVRYFLAVVQKVKMGVLQCGFKTRIRSSKTVSLAKISAFLLHWAENSQEIVK
jgi:hypothetical protein